MSDYAELIIFNGVKPWPHELETAVSLVKSGHTVVFRAKSEKYKVKTADILLDGQIWELKAPNGKKCRLSSVIYDVAKTNRAGLCLIPGA